MKRLAAMTFAAALFLSGCGGGGSDATVNPPMQPLSTNVQINLGDGPADALLAAVVTLNSMTLTSSSGSTVAVVSAPQTVEMMHLMGTVLPLSLSNLQQGTYTGATMVLGAATVTYVDPATGQLVQKTVGGPMTANLQFSPPLVVGVTPLVLNLDMDMGASVQIDAAGNVTMAPVVHASFNPVAVGSPYMEDGGMHGYMGTVNGVAGNGFSFSAPQGMTNFSCAVDGHTQFAGVSGLGMMGGNMLVSVDATAQADGTWMARRVVSMMGVGGSMGGGLVTGVTGSPVTQITLAMQEGMGIGMMPANLAGTTIVNVDSNTKFTIDNGLIDLSGLSFAIFDRSHVVTGQRLIAFSNASMGHHDGMGGMHGGGTLTATAIYLEEQGLRGTVSNYTASGTAATFTMTVPADSAFARLSGATTVTVHQQATTQLRLLSAVHNGDTIVARGLLFQDGGMLHFVASRIVGL